MPVRPNALGRHVPFKSLCHNVLNACRAPVAGAALGLMVPAAAPRLASQAVAEVQVTPASVTVGVGQKQTLFVAAFDRQGNVLPTARFTFVSSDSTIARVNGDGVVVGLRAGLAKVEARAQDQRAAVAVFVTAPAGGQPATHDPPAAQAAQPAGPAAADAAGTLRFDPPAVILLPGESQRVTASPVRGDGTAAVPIAWRSLRPSIVTAGPDGTLTGVAAGEATVRASGRGGLAATLSVSVDPAEFALSTGRIVHGPDALDTLHAMVPAQGGRAVGGGLAWRSADTTIARVGPTGIVQTLAPGETDILASGFGQEQRVHVVVYSRPEILLLSPRPAAGPVRVPLGGTTRLSARALAGDSTPVPLAPITWEVGDSTIATLDRASGQVTARALGSTSIAARLEGFEPALWVVTVFPGDLVLDHPRLGLTAGERGALTPRFADTTAGGVPEGHFDWTTDRPGVATVTGEGAVTAIVPGHAVVTAWAPWGKTASAAVFVTGDLLVSSNRAGHGFGIYQLRMTAPDTLLPVLTDTAANVQAVWSPDRSRIAFSSNRAGDYDLELADADGGNRRVLSAGTGVDGEPVWSPDGTRLVFASARGGAAQLYSVGIDGGDLRQLTASPGASTSPAFSPDGHTIAFVSSRDGGYEIYLMDADGGNQRRITHTDSRELAPRFFPGGDLAWVVDRGAREGSAIVRQTGPSSLATVVSAPASILSWSLARDGATIAYVTGRITSAAANRTAFSLVLQPVAGGPPVPVRLGPAEQPVTPAF
jgi:uncharacterized protein YjdB